MSTLFSWVRLVTGLCLGLVLLAVLPSVVRDNPDEPGLRVVMIVLGLLGFALLAAGWGVAARWAGPGKVLRGGGLAVFGLAMGAYVVTALPLPGWPGWTLFGLFAAAGLAVPVWLLTGGGRRPSPVEPDAQGRLEVSVARAPTLMLAVLAVAMAAAALVLLPVPVLGWVVGPAGVVFFGGASAWLALLAVRPGPAIRADRHGMEDRASLAGVRRISWGESTAIRDTTTFGQPTVAVTPHDWETVVGRQHAWKRPLLALSRRLTRCDDLLVSTTALPCSPRELAEVLEGMRRDNA
jgi:hypothetical protein